MSRVASGQKQGEKTVSRRPQIPGHARSKVRKVPLNGRTTDAPNRRGHARMLQPKDAAAQPTVTLSNAGPVLITGGMGLAAALAWESNLEGSHLAVVALLSSVLGLFTFLFTTRYLLSCFPRLERLRTREQPWMFLAATTDPVLQPLRGYMRHTDGDLDIASAIGLALISIAQEILFGASAGVLLHDIPSLDAQNFLQFMINLQQGMLLPMWLQIVFRWMALI